ncbi:hypothetical protein GCM10027418_27230 [Mariniluteicoccus endophyticus]
MTGRTTTAGAVGPTSPAAVQTLAWNAEGRLTQVVQDGQTTKFAYHVDGSRLIRRDDATTVLSLGDTELTLTRATNTVTAQRYVQYAGQTVAMRTGYNNADVHTLWSDLNNTGTWTVNNVTSMLETRRTLPYGTPRGPAPAVWASNRGFVQGLTDTTLGMLRIGARDYDPTTGRFLSPDPIIDLNAPTQWNPYQYGNSNPVDHPDPTGERPDDYTGEMWKAERDEYNRSSDWGRAIDAAYQTPSGRSGGQSYKNKYGLDSGWNRRYKTSSYEDDDNNYHARLKWAKKPQAALAPYKSPAQKKVEQYKQAASTDNSRGLGGPRRGRPRHCQHCSHRPSHQLDGESRRRRGKSSRRRTHSSESLLVYRSNDRAHGRRQPEAYRGRQGWR